VGEHRCGASEVGVGDIAEEGGGHGHPSCAVAQPEARTGGLRRVIVGPQMPYFHNGYPMEAPGVGIGNQEQFTYQAPVFLDQIAGVADPLTPNATFADGLRSMEIIEAIVQSAQNGGAKVAVNRSKGLQQVCSDPATLPRGPVRFRASFRQVCFCTFSRLGFRQSSFRHIMRIPRRAAPDA
jgi:hypothetical protein